MVFVAGVAQIARAQSGDGASIFQERCASCHTGAADSRAPALDALRARTPQAIVESLMTGAMRPQGSRMSGAERRAVAEYVTGTVMAGDVSGALTGRCAVPAPTAVPVRSDRTRNARWAGWSPASTNTRFQDAEAAGLTPKDLPRLKLRWTFGFPDASAAWAQPTVANGRIFVGSQNGTVYALDATSGCIHWTFAAAGGVRTAIAVSPRGASPDVVFFGDTAANAYALDADTGRLLWTQKVEDHVLARITGSPLLHDGRLYVPVSSYEEAQGADARYACCTFRGSLVAIEAATGKVVWKRYMISDEPRPRGTSTAGVTLWGPAGSAIWSAPTVDIVRGALYVATGNTYSGPAQASSDAVVALDLATGAIRWMRQTTPGDIYLTGCRSGNPNCPTTTGPDLDFGSPPMLTRTPAGKDLIVIGQKSGIGYALDPDTRGDIVWQYRAGEGGVLGGIEWGSAVDTERAYFAVSDIAQARPGGLHAVSLATGARAWFTAPPPPVCAAGRGCNAAQSSAVTAIPGVIFSGSNDGALRAYAAENGAILWEFNANRSFETVNGVPATGASMIGPGPVVVGGMVYVNAGYGAFGGRPGNVLLAFGLE
jgi:polyvinyl alcohol dehydrogenase (cytochrome)